MKEQHLKERYSNKLQSKEHNMKEQHMKNRLITMNI